HDIIQDENGLIWLATENGLNIYQKASNTFKNILRGNFLGKAQNNVWALLEDKQHVWAGTDHELLKINKSTFSVEKISIQNIINSKSLRIRDLVLINDNLLLATEGNGIIKYNIKTKAKSQFITENSE